MKNLLLTAVMACMETETISKNEASLKSQKSKGNTLRTILLLIFALQALTIHAVQVTFNGITYDDFAGSGMSQIYEGKYIHVSVVGVDNSVTGSLFIPEEPGTITASGLTFTFQVTGIAKNAFKDNTRIISVTLPNTVTTIEDDAFRGCVNLSSVTFGTGLTTVDTYWAFYDCTALSRFNVAEGNTVYSSLDGVLYNKSRTELVKYPVGKPDNTFSVPNTVLTIANSAFANSNNLGSITISENVKDIDIHAFHNCIGLTAFEVSAANTSFSAVDGILYNKNKTVIVRYPPNKASALFSIPTTVTEIYGYAFRDCQRLSSVFVSGNVVKIGYGAFGWSKIQSITLSKSVKFIDIYAFCANKDLKNLTVYWNTPAEVTIQTPTEDWEDIFYDVAKSSVTLHVPPGTKGAYLADNNWKDFNIADDANAGITGVSLSKFNIYPNPTSDSFIIDNERFIKVIIYDMLGKEILKQNANGKTEINISHLPKGIYNVSVLSEGRVIGNSKIVKQ